jgi:hypothetical protein
VCCFNPLSLVRTALWRFGPFSVHGLPDLPYQTFCVSYRLLPAPYVEHIDVFPPNKLDLSLGFPTGLSTLKHPLVLFFGGGGVREGSIFTARPVLCSLFTYLLTPWSRVLLEKLTGFAASQDMPRIYGTRKFITVPTSAPTCTSSEPATSSPHNPLPLPEDPS